MPREPADTKSPRPRPPRPISRRERWLVRSLLAAAALLVLVSLTLTIGKDVLQSIVRRWEAGRMPLAEINPPPLKELPPPAPELGLPPPPVISSTPPDVASVVTVTTDPPVDAERLVVIEPVFDGHMIEPESLDGLSDPVADSEVPDPGRNLVDELFHDSGKGTASTGQAETAPEIAGLKAASARDRIKYASAVKRMLKFLADGDQKDQPEAAKSYAEARRICTEDPRLPLAYGLYLQQIGQATAARDAFEASAVDEGKSYLLIHQAAAMSRLMTTDLRRAWPHLMQLADVAGQPAKQNYPTEWQRRRAAEWLGATAAFLESLPDDVDGRHLVDGTELRAHLPEPLQAVFDAGRTEAGRHLAELTRWTGLPSNEAAGQLTDALAKLEAQHQTAAAEVETLRESLREATHGLREANDAEKKARGELTLAGRQHRLAREAVADLSQPRTYTYTQTTYTSQTNSQGRQQRVPTTVLLERPENSSERSSRLAQLKEASAMLAKIDGVLPGLKSQHDEANTARDDLAVQVRDQTAETRSQLALAQRRLHQTERLLSRLQELAADPDKLPDRLKSPTLVLDWNAEEIADRLKATFETPGKSKEAAPAAE